MSWLRHVGGVLVRPFRAVRRGVDAGTRRVSAMRSPWAFLGAGGLFVMAAILRPDVALALVVLGGGFTLLERWRPLRPQPPAFRREGAATDAGAFVIDQVLVAAAATVLVALLAPVVGPLVPSALPEELGSLPGWARWLVAFCVAEMCGYWSHRLSHEVPFLWRFHAVHHSAPQLDWLAPSRRHPVDAMFSAASTTLPILLLGLSPPAVVSVFALRRIQGLLLHANVNCRLGPLEWIVATPFFHHWHHTADPGLWDCNYAGSVPALDWVFGSLHLPDEWPQSYGCDVEVPASGYLARVASPWAEPPGGPVPEALPGPA